MNEQRATLEPPTPLEPPKERFRPRATGNVAFLECINCFRDKRTTCIFLPQRCKRLFDGSTNSAGRNNCLLHQLLGRRAFKPQEPIVPADKSDALCFPDVVVIVFDPEDRHCTPTMSLFDRSCNLEPRIERPTEKSHLLPTDNDSRTITKAGNACSLLVRQNDRCHRLPDCFDCARMHASGRVFSSADSEQPLIAPCIVAEHWLRRRHSTP